LNGIVVAPITEAHAEGFHACLDAVARERRYLAQTEALPLERIRAFVRENVSNDAVQFVALEGDRVVGWCDIFPGWAQAVAHRGTLGMGVAADHRGRGIGRRLLAACLDKARAKGITRVELEVRADNERAIRLYESMGFEREAVHRNGLRYDGVCFDSIGMCLLLGEGAPTQEAKPDAAAAQFYDGLASRYHLLYADWEAAIVQQGTALSRLLEEAGLRPGDPILDAACGIGTQTLGLAQRGHQMTASDISGGAVQRLREELAHRGLRAEARVDDLRLLQHTPPNSMVALLACDNSLPHLLSDEEILQALRSCHRCLRPGGVLVLSVRDYAAIPRVNPDVRPYGVRRVGENRFIAVQVWEWEGDQYDLRMYLTTETPDGRCSTQVLRSRYYAITIERLVALLAEAGFVAVQRRDDVLFQPVLLARRPA
jgi:ribosomal protein S18 acetylase RimI-like enzyme/SAM-dependent methyltransferase